MAPYDILGTISQIISPVSKNINISIKQFFLIFPPLINLNYKSIFMMYKIYMRRPKALNYERGNYE